ncbi:MAG: CSLREA domain-containing protein [Actinomycetota bacterium]|nr:CSLREA domain-containing protein [Actinomycetota bacterium]
MTARGIAGFSSTLVAALALAPAVAGAATIKVDTTSDELNSDGDCSLREAVQAANTNSSVDGCVKGQGAQRDTVALKPKNYELTIPSTNEDSNANGDLDVAPGGPLTIRGVEQSGGTALSQNGEDRVLDVGSINSDLTIEKLDLNGGDVTSFTAAHARGGSVRANGATVKLKLRRVGIKNANALVGGAIYASNQTKLTVLDSQLTENRASGTGGAIATANSAKTTVKGSSLRGNSVTSTTASVEGGAITHSAATGSLRVVDSSVAVNEVTGIGPGNAALGGGIYSGGPLEIRRSFIGSNDARATTSGTAERGDGLYLTAGVAKVVNSTFFFNDSGDADNKGGAVYVGAGSARLQFTTLTGNTTATGDGSLATGVGTIELGRSIIDNHAFSTPCDGNVTSLGFNVSEDDDANCGFADSDAVDVGDVGLAASAQDNGGRTDTVRIGAGSPAKNFVPKKSCKASGGEDQRAYERPAGKRCDAGAYERGAKKP